MSPARRARPAADPTPAPPSAKGRQRHEALVDAAVAAAAEVGPGQLSLQDVAAAAGVAKSVALYYFRDRAGLLAALAARAVAPWQAAHEPLAEPAGDPRDHLNRWLAAVFELASGQKPLLQLYLALLCDVRDPAARAVLRACDDVCHRRLVRLLARGHDQYCWHAPDPQRAATLLRALVDGLLLEAVRSPAPAAGRLHGLCRGAVLDLLVRR